MSERQRRDQKSKTEIRSVMGSCCTNTTLKRDPDNRGPGLKRDPNKRDPGHTNTAEARGMPLKAPFGRY